MGFHFPIMPRIYMGIKKGSGEDMAEILRRTPPIPENCQWCIFLRNHDELTLEMVTEEERQWMWEQYAPEPRMRLNLGIRRRLAPLLDHDESRIRLAYSLLFSLPGSPILYYGDEIGMADNIWLDDRNGVRTPMQWEAGATADFSGAPPQSLYAPVISEDAHGPEYINVKAQRADPNSIWNVIRQMIAIRRKHRAFGRGEFEWLDVQNKTLAVFQRTHNNERILVVHNLSDAKQSFSYPTRKSVSALTDHLTQKQFDPVHERLEIELMPYEYLWLK
jgi:maltose alpha-D-glucosyltransferase/alpha-amylase